MDRIYEPLLDEHMRDYRQMAFVAGPRQVGKTTSARAVVDRAENSLCLNWDVQADRRLVVRGEEAVAAAAGLDALSAARPVILFDEIHKYGKWKSFLKGFYDSHGGGCRIIVTGSGRLDVYKRGGDSLMGRYFLYRMHPLSVGEIVRPGQVSGVTRAPLRIGTDEFDALMRFGGFPEPFLTATTRFHNRWLRMRTELLFREDLRDLTRVQEVRQLEILAEILREQAGQPLNLSSLANEVKVSVDTIRRWISTLESLFYCFTIRPWFSNVPKSLRKQPKIYLWDWSGIADPGGRRENLVACHLLKAVHWWTDTGLGDYGLYFLRDKAKREVDFLVVRDRRPWFLVEVKSSGRAGLSRSLGYFQEVTGCAHAFQLAFDIDYIEKDCFARRGPVKVPATTFLSQLV